MTKEHDRTAVPADVLLHHVPAMRSLARRLVSCRDAAEDLVQDTLIAAQQHTRKDGVPLTYWLGRVLRNHFKMWVRAETRRSRWESVAWSWHNDDEETPERLCICYERLVLLSAAIDLLPNNYRGTVRSHYFEGLTPAEIAHRDSVPSATVRARLHRSLAILRTQLSQTTSEHRMAIQR